MRQPKKQEIIAIFVCLSYMGYFYLLTKLQYKNHWLISLNSIHTKSQLCIRITFDFLIMLPLPLVILFRYRRKLGDIEFRIHNSNLCIWLLLTYLLFFFLHKEYSIYGIYKAIFYLIIVAFSEEIIFRGYLYSCVKTSWRTKAIIISGLLYGAMHAILPSILASKSIYELMISMVSELGGGILVGFIFISIMEKSRTILVPILIHALLDYSYGPWGLIVLILTIIYLNKKESQAKKNSP